jgi:hypothetical protein
MLNLDKIIPFTIVSIFFPFLTNTQASLAGQQNSLISNNSSVHLIACAAHEKKEFRVLSCSIEGKSGYSVCSKMVNKVEPEDQQPETCEPCKPKPDA